ncbi:MAG: protein kinase [Burkholderiales bacterium]|nr:protein kinase [Burkholderiales bacterium]
MNHLPSHIGKYEIRSVLGSGAMATVYQAYDPVIERTLAIKVVDKARLYGAERNTILARFRIEARAAGRLQHPNIVSVYDFGEEGELVYLVMECVFGKPLTAFLSGEDFRGEPDKVCDILLQMLSALGYSHAQGVVHRDIKPANIMVSREGVIKVADFGVARIESSLLTQAGDLIGTPSYMSPEQFAGETADARADIYAAAVIFYELLTRRRPFEGNNNSVIMHRVFTETPEAPSQMNPLLSDGLDSVVMRGMAKDPGDRFQNAREFEQAIRDAMMQPLLREADPATQSRPTIAPNLLRVVRGRNGTETGGASPEPSLGTGALPLPRPVPPPQRLDRRPSILFVDDETRILTALHALFRSQYRVHTADDPRKALELVKSTPFQVVVSDQRMPHMLGVELLRQVREIAPKSVRILLTGYSDLASIVGSINQGEVWRFINKPWDSQDIQRTIAEAVAVAEETPEVPAWQMPAPPRFEESILTLDPGDELTPLLVRTFAERHWVAQARDLEEAVTLLQEREVAVLVADLDAGHQEIKSLLHLLKREYPQIVTLAVTQAVDAELLIDLINEAQVHRFVSKPFDPAQLASYVEAAMNRYHTYKATPALAKVPQQVAPPRPGPAAAVTSGLLDRLRALRARFR